MIPSSLKPAVPSPTLLRFLRSQYGNGFTQWQAPPVGTRRSGGYMNKGQHRLTAPASDPCPGRFVQTRGFSSATISSLPRTLHACALFVPSAPAGRLRTRSPRYMLTRIQPFTCSARHNRTTLRQLLGLRRAKKDAKLRSHDVPLSLTNPSLYDEGNIFNPGRSLVAKAGNAQRLRCTEFDENGSVTLVNGEFRKTELIAKYGLLPRDLRKIDSSVLPNILVRQSAILISLLHLRVLIKSDRVLVFDIYGSSNSYAQSVFMYDLEGKLAQKRDATGLPYEFRALEAVLVSVTTGLESEFEGVREPVVRVLRALEEDIDRSKLRHLLIYSKRLSTFEQKARLVRDAINTLLDADDDLAAMYLTERSKGIVRDEEDHQEVEMLLESYHKVCDEIVQASSNLVTNIRNTEEIIKAILDANRNSLMLLDLKFNIGTLCLAAGTLLSALYGMNLKNFIEESDYGFIGVSVSCVAISAIVSVACFSKLRRVQRVRMWGEEGIQTEALRPLTFGASPSPVSSFSSHSASAFPASGRPNWRADSVDPLWTGLPGEARAERMARLKREASVAKENVDRGNAHVRERQREKMVPVSEPRTEGANSGNAGAALGEDSRKGNN